MDVKTKIRSMLTDDIYGSENGEIVDVPYDRYYQSTSLSQPRIVVSSVICDLLMQDKTLTCNFGESTFTLRMNSESERR